ncbi:glycosyltransferase family 9 protein [Desulfosoma caldarium]|uniref:ADP-heptose:LPS heptosyltransferase n=1 Tax=Desulfosoma caldarium TaxID=610254 RepID=A0A3N1UPY0_9BACT|nr:glycosyltransferase family 9 protein [Desulfosoma caldarium]ROQ90810.1 ADP-heptose:LPS heptosyltransferase [Desulfosoma caldarium]
MVRESLPVGFWHQGALGDFVLFTPVLDAFQEVFPRVPLFLWTVPAYKDLLYGKPYCSALASCDGPFWQALFVDDAWASVPVPEALRRCQAFFWVGQKGALPIVDRLKERLTCPVYWLQSFPDSSPTLPVTEFMVQQMTALGLALPKRRPKLAADPEATKDVAAWLGQKNVPCKGYGVVHMGSGGLRKVWPISRWRSLIEVSSGFFGAPMVLLMGPADERLMPCVDAFSRTWGWPVYRSRDLRKLTALLRGARFFVGVDSGVSHVAAAMDVPSLVIFGPTNPAVWAPQGNHVWIYQDSWTPQEVFRDEKDPEGKVGADVLRCLQMVMGI